MVRLPRYAVRDLYAFLGPETLKWGFVTTAIGFGTFAVDLLFAMALQRFLVAVEFVSSSASTAWFGPIRSPIEEAAIFIIVGLVRVCATWINGLTTGLSYVSFETKQRKDIARWGIQSGHAPLGRVTTLFNDVVVGSAATVSNVFFLLGRGALGLCILIALVRYSAQLTALLLGLVALAMPLQRFIDVRLRNVSRVIQTSLSQSVDRLALGVKNALFLQIHGLVGGEVRRIAAHMDVYGRSSRHYHAHSATRVAIPQVLALVVVVGVASEGASLFDQKSNLIAYLYLALRLFQSLAEMARIVANLRLNGPRLNVLMRWWHEEFDPVYASAASEGSSPQETPGYASPLGWRCRDIRFEWERRNCVLRDFNLDIRPGSMTVVVGPSGSGKTTLLLLLVGMVAPTSGSVRVLTPDGELDLPAVRERMLANASFVGPDPFVVPGTIRDFLFLGLPKEPDEEEVRSALELAHCEFVDRLPRGLDHPVTEQGGGLSAGQKQRLALARALLRKPRILLLDEATSNLDAASEAAIVSSLAQLKGKMTIVAVTHRDALLAIADHVVTIAPPSHAEAVGEVTV